MSHHFPAFKEKFALVGNLRSAFGINIILYNLALNPHVRNLIIWAPDKLSNTNIGLAGKQNLINLWKNGAASSLVEEINPSVIKTIISNVKVIDISNQEKIDFNLLKFEREKPYMEPVIFPEFKVKFPDTLPSEKHIYLIRRQKGADAYLHLLHAIWKYGEKTKIDETSEEVKEIRGATVVIEGENPDKINLPPWIPNTKTSLENYYQTQFSATPCLKKIFHEIYKFERPVDYAYLYAERMYALPRPEVIDKILWFLWKSKGYELAKKFLINNSQKNKKYALSLIKEIEKQISSKKKRLEILLEGLIPPTDQIAYVVERIKRKPIDLDKIVLLWDVRYDSLLESGRPCVYKISFTVRKGVVDVHLTARSHDIGEAWFYNFYAITKLLGNIAKQTNHKPGFIIMESESAHIYQRDWNKIEKLIKEEVIEKPARMYFDPHLDGDPRGVVNISTIDGKIKLKLQDAQTGKLFHEFEARTAREALYKLKHFDFISRVDHAIFIGSELAKAEICLKLGIEYKYDTSLSFPTREKISS